MDEANDSRHLGIVIERSAQEVYDYAVEPSHLPEWAAGVGRSVEQVGGVWYADAPMGRVTIRFVPRNDHGVLDHDVTLPSGETVTNPLRVLPRGADSEVVFTLRRGPEMTAEDFEQDAKAVRADLLRLKAVLEAGRR